MRQLRLPVASIIVLFTAAPSASAQMARANAARPIGATAAQMRTPAQRLAISRALLDSARQSLAAGESVLRAGDIAQANARFAEARAMRAAIVPDATLASDLATIDASLKKDAEAVAVGNTVLANAAIPPAPAVSSMSVPAVPPPPPPPPPPVPVSHAPEHAAIVRPHVIVMSAARRAALDSAAEQNRRALATSVDIGVPTAGLDEIGGRVLTVHTFESGSPPAPLGARTYRRTFATASTRYLYTEVSVGFTSEAATPTIDLTCWTKRDDSVAVEQPVRVSHESDASVFLFTVGIGWGEPGRLEPGHYVTGCDHDGVAVLADSFTVTGTTAHSAYVAGEVSARAGQWTEAAAAYDTAVRLDSGVALYHYGHGTALERLYNDSAAADEYAAAIRLAPDELQFHVQYAGVLQHLRRLDDAIAEHREIIRLDPDDARRHMQLAELLVQNGDPVGALLEYRTAASMDASEPYYRKRIAELAGKK